MTHLMAFHHMKCGCQLDEDPDFMHVCNMHFYADALLSACIEDDHKKMADAVSKSCGLQSESDSKHAKRAK